MIKSPESESTPAAPARAPLRFDVLTLFPELFAPFVEAGITRRAYASGQIVLKLWNPRDYAEGNYRRVDDRPFGGGPGMVMLAEPLARCLPAIQAERADAAPVVLFSPIGAALNHAAVERWSAGEGAVLICGRYEGIDQRFIDAHVTHQISLGDFVLSGGEIAALALLDAVAAKRYGGLEDKRIGSVPVNYLSDLDITGGNSGSPVLDAEGKLVGLAFDGTIESVSSNWVFDPVMTRMISVDQRYMRWIMQEVMPAPQLLKELGVAPKM